MTDERWQVVDLGEAAEVGRGGDGGSSVLLTCEHASMRLPEGWSWTDEDQWLVGTHWSYDLGGAELTRELAAELGAWAVLARFTRLLCDANRAEDDGSLIRATAEGRPVGLNGLVGPDDRERRLSGFYRPYHDAIDRVARDAPGRAVLSVHTFTPVYEGNVREVEVGMLYDADEEDLALDLALAITDAGQMVWDNEPYSGKDGLIYSATRHAKANARHALEIEVRQDLATDPAWRAVFVKRLAAGLAEVGLL